MSRLFNCDFCYVKVRPEEAWTYHWPPTCVPANNGSMPMDDDGWWCACFDCHLLVDARDGEGLLKRSLAGDPVAYRIPEAAAWKQYLFDWLLAMPLLEETYQGPPRERPFDGQHR